jgi:hypothetical protein
LYWLIFRLSPEPAKYEPKDRYPQQIQKEKQICFWGNNVTTGNCQQKKEQEQQKGYNA